MALSELDKYFIEQTMIFYTRNLNNNSNNNVFVYKCFPVCFYSGIAYNDEFS